MTGIFTLPWSTPFLPALARGLLERTAGDPLALSRYTLLLPTRRAIRALQDAFLTVSGRPALLLPAMLPLGDVDDEDFLFEDDTGLDDFDLPPALNGLRRLLLLSNLVVRRDKYEFTQALKPAEALGRLMDSLQIESIPLEALDDLVPAELAGHWQDTLKFLKILRDPWRAILQEEGVSDAAERRIAVLERRAALWRQSPPPGPVIVAGSTGTVPATAALMKVVAALPQGEVLLPGLDLSLPEDAWSALAPSHPQFALHRLLEKLNRTVSDIVCWPDAEAFGTKATPARQQRQDCLNQAMYPAAYTYHWHAFVGESAVTLDGLSSISCRDSQEEAAFIAVTLREAVERPNRTAVLVTPDRALAKRVRAELLRWDIDIDDTAGEPLAETGGGAFLRLTAQLLLEDFAPVPLLSVLKHPFTRLGLPADIYRQRIGLLDRHLRGPRPLPGFAGLRRQISTLPLSPEEKAGLQDLIDRLEAGTKNSGNPMADVRTIPEFLRAHIAFADRLATDVDGNNPLWQGEAGALLADAAVELEAAAVGVPAVSADSYMALLDLILRQKVVRSRYRRHPRLAILGPLEARLQSADLVILSGLNEGTWPGMPDPGPWLSRPMRLTLGLPDPERRIGLAAHDFCQALTAPEVVITRAEKVDGAPTVISRWLLRLNTLLDHRNIAYDNRPGLQRLEWIRKADQPARIVPTGRPSPKPPVAARPRRLSVTQVEVWMRDAYALYARHILKLLPLDGLDIPFGPADRGMAIHAALKEFIDATKQGLPPDADKLLLKIGEKSFAHLMDRPEVAAFWWPRFKRIAEWVVTEERQRRETHRPAATEVSGHIEFMSAGGGFRLTAKADRIDRRQDREWIVVDYKTGAVPSGKAMQSGLSPQMPLEAAIAEAGGFSGLSEGSVGRIEYWQLVGDNAAGSIKGFDAEKLAPWSSALQGLQRLVQAFDAADTGYTAQNDGNLRFNDYAHLARTLEWSSGGDAE